MTRTLIALITGAAVASAVFLLLPKFDASASQNGVKERWVNANHMQIQVSGEWTDVHMTPLADHLCKGKNPHYRQYCE